MSTAEILQFIRENLSVESLLSELSSYQKYESGKLKIIGIKGLEHTDAVVKEFMSYGELISNIDSFSVIKVEGIEETFNIPSRSVHLFFNNTEDYSFDWHTDDVDVCLYVLQGNKTVYFEEKIVSLAPGESLEIPKGKSHKVYSDKGTLALSVEVKF